MDASNLAEETIVRAGAIEPAAHRALVGAERSATFLDAVVLAFDADRAASAA